MRHPRRAAAIACACLMAVSPRLLSSQPASLSVERDGDWLRVTAPAFHFLEGRALEQLRNGATATYLLSLSVREAGGGPRLAHAEERFVFSYDLWEEKFSVAQGHPPRRSASHLTAAAGEAWCLEALRVPVASVPAVKTVVVKLECSIQEEGPPPSEGFTLSALIEILSRKRTTAPSRWEIASRPLRLADLRDTSRH